MRNKNKKRRGKLYNKKAISPLIATVILFGFTIVLTVLMTTWSGKLTEDTEGIVATMIQSSEDIKINIKEVNYDEYGKIILIIENTEARRISNLTVILAGDKATQTFLTSGLDEFETKKITIIFTPLITGYNITKVTVIPITSIAKQSYLHKISTETKLVEITNITFKDTDLDNCPDIIDFNPLESCPKESCLDSIACNEFCQPIICLGTADSCGCTLGSCTTCSPTEECINYKCQEKCQITSAYWSKTEANQSELINLTVTGNNCDNRTIHLLYEEIDTLTSNDIIDPLKYNLPITLTFEGNTAKGEWTTLWFRDTDSLDINPKIRFIVVESTTISDTLTLMSGPPTMPLAVCIPPGQGITWNINDVVDCIGVNIIVRGDINIDSTGVLNIVNSKVTIISPGGNIIDYGKLNLINSKLIVEPSLKSITLKSSGLGGGKIYSIHSDIAAVSPSTIEIKAEPNTKLEIANSNLTNLGNNYNGLIVNTPYTRINNTLFNKVETIAFDKNHHVFINNTIIGNDHTPYLIAFGWTDSSHNNTIINNTIRNVKGAAAGEDNTGISISGDDNTILNNQVTGVLGTDIFPSRRGGYLYEGAFPMIVLGNNNTIEFNNISNNFARARSSALQIIGNNNSITNNSIVDNMQNMVGISLGTTWWETTENNTIDNNTILRNAAEGMHIANTKNTTISNNLLADNLGQGNIYLEKNNNCTINNNKIEGIHLGITIKDSNENFFDSNVIDLSIAGYYTVGNQHGLYLTGTTTNNLFRNTTIITSGVNSHGILIDGTNVANNKIEGITISPDRSSNGIRFTGSAENNTIENVKIKTEGIKPYNGISFIGPGVRYNTIKNGDIYSLGFASQSILFQDSATQNKIIDTDLNSLLNSKAITVKEGTGSNFLLNVTYIEEQVTFKVSNPNDNYEIYRQWYLNITVIDEETMLPITDNGANVTGYENFTGQIRFNFSELTLFGEEGRISLQNVTEYIQNQTSTLFFANYTFNTTEWPPGLDKYEENITTYNITNNTNLLVKLSPKSTAGLSLAMSDTLRDGIKWTITSLPVIDEGAEGNMGEGSTEYILTLYSLTDTDVLLSIRADGTLTGPDIIPLDQETYEFSETDPIVPPQFKTPLSTDYQLVSPSPLHLTERTPKDIYFKFYLTVNGGQLPGTYNNNIDFKLEQA